MAAETLLTLCLARQGELTQVGQDAPSISVTSILPRRRPPQFPRIMLLAHYALATLVFSRLMVEQVSVAPWRGRQNCFSPLEDY